MIYRIATWNVNGIRACYKKGFLKWLSTSKRQIICLQETKASLEQLKKEYPDLADPKNFHVTYVSAEKKGYSGVALFSHKKMSKPDIKIGLGKEKFDKEGRLIIAEYPEFILINGYFPNGQRDHCRVPYKLEFSDEVIKKANALKKKKKKPVLICGDINTAHCEIDLANPKQNHKTTGFLPEEREWLTKCFHSGWEDIFRKKNKDKVSEYTWWTYRSNCREKNIGWRIDYFIGSSDIFSSVKNCVHRPEVLGSDHCPVYCDLSF